MPISCGATRGLTITSRAMGPYCRLREAVVRLAQRVAACRRRTCRGSSVKRSAIVALGLHAGWIAALLNWSPYTGSGRARRARRCPERTGAAAAPTGWSAGTAPEASTGGAPRPSCTWQPPHERAMKCGPRPSRACVEAGASHPVAAEERIADDEARALGIGEIGRGKRERIAAVGEHGGVAAGALVRRGVVGCRVAGRRQARRTSERAAADGRARADCETARGATITSWARPASAG